RERLWLHDMLLERADGAAIDLDGDKARLEAAFLMVMRGQAENDGYNALTLVKHAAIAGTIVELFYARFDPFLSFRGTGAASEAGIQSQEPDSGSGASRRPGTTESGDRAGKQAALAAKIEDALQAVESLDEDRILRQFVNAVQAAVRTNFFQTGKDGQAKAIIAVKFASRKLTDLPLPRPLYEIFVYSPRVEGVHLRFGKVARGGIRWSDRPQDFRTE